MDGNLDGETVNFTHALGKRRYKDKKPEQFWATRKFPPVGQKDYTATSSPEVITGKTDEGTEFELKRTVRQSPTLGLKPTDSAAVILFDGSNKDEWNGGR